MRVKCNWCDEIFDEEDLIVDMNSDLGAEACPYCGRQDYLMDLEY